MRFIHPARRIVATAFLLLVAACAIQLVPDYDPALLDGTNDANVAALTLFAQVEDGSPQSEYPLYSPRYADVIGKFEALRQSASARYVPPLAEQLAERNILRDFCDTGENPAACLNVTPESMGEIVSTLRRMRQLHRDSGLEPVAVAAFRNRYDIQIDQVLTIENALRR